MTVELALCIALTLATFPFSRSIAAHYAIFAAVNGATLDIQAMDSSLLVILFLCLTVADAVIFIAGGRAILLVSAVASAALCFESMLNMDWLLSHSTYLNAIVNSIIIASLVKGSFQWTHGK